MVELSNSMLVAVVLVTLVVAAAGTYVAYVNSGQNHKGFLTTGFVTSDTGNVTLSINNTLAIQVNSSYGMINFGTCVPRPGSSYWCASNDSAACDGTSNNNCTGDNGSVQYIQVDNVGNVEAAITLGSNCNASTLIGGTAPALQYTTGNCNGTAVTSWTNLNAASGLAACTNITTASKGPGRMKFYVNVTIPQDASGYDGVNCAANQTVITFSATSA